jgi:hypothetical protein
MLATLPLHIGPGRLGGDSVKSEERGESGKGEKGKEKWRERK